MSLSLGRACACAWQVDEPEETWLDQSEVEPVASEDESVWSSVFESTGAEAATGPLRHFPDWLPAEEVRSPAQGYGLCVQRV